MFHRILTMEWGVKIEDEIVKEVGYQDIVL